MIDKGLYKNRKKFRIGSEEGKDVSGREYSGGPSEPAGGSGGGGGSNNIVGGGGADLSKLKSLPPVMTTLPSNIPTSDDKTFTISTDPMDLREQYRIGNIPTSIPGGPSFVTFNDPYSSLGLEQRRYDNFVDARNLANTTLPKTKTGLLSLDTILNVLTPIRDFTFGKNKDFFAENVAGKYGYGYGVQDYKNYMEDRLAGKVNAYGRTLTDTDEKGRANNIGIESIDPIIPMTKDQGSEEEIPMTDYERYQSYLQNFFGGT